MWAFLCLIGYLGLFTAPFGSRLPPLRSREVADIFLPIHKYRQHSRSQSLLIFFSINIPGIVLGIYVPLSLEDVDAYQVCLITPRGIDCFGFFYRLRSVFVLGSHAGHWPI